MAGYVEGLWEPRLGEEGLSRAQRAGGRDRAYLPDPLPDRRFLFTAETAADVVDAERALTRLDLEAAALRDTEALARILLRAESVASSQIEGLVVSA